MVTQKSCKFCSENIVYNRDTRKYDNISDSKQHFCILGGISQILANQYTILNILKSMDHKELIDFDKPLFSNKVKEVPTIE